MLAFVCTSDAATHCLIRDFFANDTIFRFIADVLSIFVSYGNIGDKFPAKLN